jgi:hypothetical protein
MGISSLYNRRILTSVTSAVCIQVRHSIMLRPCEAVTSCKVHSTFVIHNLGHSESNMVSSFVIMGFFILQM